MKHLWALVPIAAVLLAYYLNHRVPDLRYQLSSSIPVPTGKENESRNVQQLAITNAGTAIAQKIQIRVRKPLVDLSVTKNSMADVFRRFDNPGGLEIVYEDLPPNGKIECVFTLEKNSLVEQDVDVRSAEGVGTPALATSNGLGRWIERILYFGAFAFFVWSGIRDFGTTMLRLNTRSKPAEILQKNKPFFVSENEWKELRTDALDHMYKTPNGLEDPSSWEGLPFLDAPRPPFLSEEEWRQLVSKVKRRFEALTESVIGRARLYHRAERIALLMKLKQPLHFTDSEWKTFVEALSKTYVDLDIASHFDWRDMPELDTIAGDLRSPKPLYVLDTDWQRRRKIFQALYFAALLWEGGGQAQADFALIPELQARRLTRFWKAAEDEQRNIQKGIELAGSEAALAPLKRKMLRQLEIIDTFLKDPSILGKIEDYDNPFSPGNFANLKELALKAQNQPRS